MIGYGQTDGINVSNVYWLHEVYPDKDWIIHGLAEKAAIEFMTAKITNSETTMITMPEQFLEGQFMLEINRNLAKLNEEIEKD